MHRALKTPFLLSWGMKLPTGGFRLNHDGQTHTYTNTHTNTFEHTRTHTHAHTHIHANTHTYTRTHTHTHHCRWTLLDANIWKQLNSLKGGNTVTEQCKTPVSVSQSKCRCVSWPSVSTPSCIHYPNYVPFCSMHT